MESNNNKMLYMAMAPWVNLPKPNSPMKAPASTERKYPMLYVMTANMLFVKRQMMILSKYKEPTYSR